MATAGIVRCILGRASFGSSLIRDGRTATMPLQVGGRGERTRQRRPLWVSTVIVVAVTMRKTGLFFNVGMGPAEDRAVGFRVCRRPLGRRCVRHPFGCVGERATAG